jgi:hypothetical protein
MILNITISYLYIIIYIFIYNNPYMIFFNDWISTEIPFYLYNYIFTWILLFIWLILIDTWLIYIWRFFYTKIKNHWNWLYTNHIIYKLYNKIYFIIWNIYFLWFIIRFIPILSHIWSIMMWMNNINIKKIIKIYLLGYSFFLFIWYLIIKFDIFSLFIS